MSTDNLTKIIYFDKETIQNILQEQHHGDYKKTIETNMSVQNEGEIETSGKIKLDMPFVSRIAFLFSGRIAASYIVRRDRSTTITSTELSEFEKLKSKLVKLPTVQLHDIENSSTSMRVAGAYMQVLKSGVDGVDTNEFKKVMDNYDGYDTYSIDDKKYVRFNNSAFVSNYKRNDLLTTTMNLYCIPVGIFDRERFDFVKQLSKMENLLKNGNSNQTIADVFPIEENDVEECSSSTPSAVQSKNNDVELYDVVYACIASNLSGGSR